MGKKKETTFCRRCNRPLKLAISVKEGIGRGCKRIEAGGTIRRRKGSSSPLPYEYDPNQLFLPFVLSDISSMKGVADGSEVS